VKRSGSDVGAHALPAGVRGRAERGFGRVVESFAKLVTRGRGGGALVVRLRGETVLDLCTGWADRAHTRPWKPETLALSFSTTKGAASTVIHRLVERGELAYDEPIATYWPEFAAGGKGRVTVRDLLTHRAGLWSVRAVAERPEDLLDHLAIEERLAARAVRAPTERSAYHAITYGWLVAGLARRVTGGRSLPELVRTEIAEPLGVEGLHIGVNETAREFIAQPVGSALRHLGAASRYITPVLTGVKGTRAAHDALIAPGFHELFEGSEPSIWNTEMPAVNGALSADALGCTAPWPTAARRRALAFSPRRPSAASAASMSAAPTWSSACACGGGSATTTPSVPARRHRGRSATTGTADPADGRIRTSAYRSASSRTGSAPSRRRWPTSRSTA
jgi:CubicO group peptidase (beta-lactamase class C family)